MKQVVQRTEFKDQGAMVKHFECRTLQSKMPVTKGLKDRLAKDPIFDAFGIGEERQAIKGNAYITMLHRENTWYPHYEFRQEDDGLGA